MTGYPPTRARTRRRSLALAAAVVVGVGTLAGMPAQADTVTTASPGFTASAGVIRFEKVASGPRVALYETPTSATPVQSVPVNVSALNCTITNLAQVRTLLDISVVGGKNASVYMVKNGLGTIVSGSGCGARSGKITAAQSIVLKPGTSLDSEFTSASVNIEGKLDADLGWTAKSGGGVVETGNDTLGAASDNAPDASNADNHQVQIAPDATFDELALTESSGNSGALVTMENGGDAPGGLPSEFFLGAGQEYAVDCTDENTVSENGDESVSSVTFERLANGYNPAKDPTCYKVGVTVEIRNNTSTEGGESRDVVFVDNTNFAADGTLQEVRANLTIVWRVPRYENGALRTAGEIDLELAREITFTDDLAQLQPVQWCGHDVAQPEGYAAEPEHPAGHPWCVVTDDRIVDGDDIVQTMVFHGQGDPSFR